MCSRNQSNVKLLFELWCEVKYVPNWSDDLKTPSGVIVDSFPESFNEAKTIADIPAFVFPCEMLNVEVEFYSFVLTNEDSKWRFGYCRYDPKTQTALVMISYLSWHDTFRRLLSVLAEMRQNNQTEFRKFLKQAYMKGVPDPGASLTLPYNSGISSFVFTRPLQFQLPSIPGNHNLSLYYSFAYPKNMIAVFAAMLAERRIIFTSSKLSKLSSCIQAANAFLYPMVWQHIFIPILPMKLKDYLSAPMPYLVGVAESILNMMTPEELGDVVIFNCDSNVFESPFDDVNELPTEIVSQLKKQLSQTSQLSGDGISKIFLEVLVQLIGGYRDAVEFYDTGKQFNRDKFIESRPSNLRPFLTKMMQLQIFQQFIDERLQMLNTGLGFSDEFEIETARYAVRKEKRKHRNIFKNVKDMTNPAVRSAVKSVKDGSRGIKTFISSKTKTHDHMTPATTSHSTQSNSYFVKNIQLSNNHTILNNAGRHSAPSSPLCNKRHVNELRSDVTDNRTLDSLRPVRNLDYLSVSSYTSSDCTTNELENGGASCINTPRGSVSSSMNLAQELEDHPLFKPPIVDRTLKKSKTLGTQQQMHFLRTTTSTPTTTTSISLVRQKPVMGSGIRKFRQQTGGDAKKNLATGINNLERTCWKNYANSDEQSSSSNTSVSSTSASLLSSSSITSDSNVSFVSAASNDNSKLVLNHQDQVQLQQKHQLVKQSQQQQQQPQKQQQQLQPPVPLPRLRKEKSKEMNYNKNNPLHHRMPEEQQEQQGETGTKDLIYLDDFDLQDFDPLNTNARPLPALTRNLKISTLPQKLQTQMPQIITNLNTHSDESLEPPPLPKSLPPSLPQKQNNDDDFELLRKYGLDQFKLPTSASSAMNTPTHILPSNSTTRSNWTTFE